MCITNYNRQLYENFKSSCIFSSERILETYVSNMVKINVKFALKMSFLYTDQVSDVMMLQIICTFISDMAEYRLSLCLSVR